MPHATRRIGHVEISALCDGVTRSSGTADESFPGASAEAWEEARGRYPDTFDGDAWRLHVHCFVLRTGDRTILVDTGVGPESAPAFAWSGIRGALPAELRAIGVEAADVDDVVITHVHDDHLGWNVAEGSADPMFANARYLVHRADWDLMEAAEDEEDREIHDVLLAPLAREGVVERSSGRVELAPGVAVEHAPGHTPGHQIVLVDAADERAILAADLVNHPVMLLQPGVNGATDMDPARAAATRARTLARIDREDRLVATSHLPEPFGRFVREGERHVWLPD